MTVKVLVLKSSEKLICDLEEVDDGNQYRMQYPRKVPSINYIQRTNTLNVSYESWCNLSYEEDILIPKDWVVCVLDPHPELVVNYEEAIASIEQDLAIKNS